MNIKYIIASILIFLSVQVNAINLSVSECREMALRNDEDIKIAQNRVRQSDLDRGIAKSAYLPKFDINGSALYLTPNPSMGASMDLNMKGVYMAGISLTQPVFTGGKIITANKLSKVGKQIADDQLEATTMDIIAEAEKTYWMYVAVLSKISMIEAYMTQLDSIYNFTRDAYELGLTTSLNISRVETRQAELQYRLKQAQTGADLCRMSLCRIIGVDENEPIYPTENLDFTFQSEKPFAGIDNRPELKMAWSLIDVKKLDVKMVLSDYLPTIGLQLGWNAFGNMKMTTVTSLPDGTIFPYTQSIDYRGFMGAVAVSIPLFHWGEGFRKVKKAKIEVENAALSFEKNRKLMELQSRQTYNNYIDGVNLIESATKALNEATENLSSITEQYQVGLMTLTDLLEAQSQWHTSYSNLIEAKTQYKINEVEYLRSVGQLNP